MGVLVATLACSSEQTNGAAPTQTSDGSSSASVGGAGGQAMNAATSAGSGVGGMGGSATALRIGDIRVHLIKSSIDDLNGAGTFATEAEQKTALDGFLQHINSTFSVAAVEWRIESVRTQPAGNEACYQEVIDGTVKGAACLRQNVDASAMLAPNGWDMFVVRRTSALGFGGVYACSVAGQGSPGAFFVPWENANGGPQAKRKWSHELGHAMGLPHTPCEAAFANHLMMSGSCSHAAAGRKDLDDKELKRIDLQYAQGGPAVCGSVDLDWRPE